MGEFDHAFGSQWAPVRASEDLQRVLALPRRPQLDVRSAQAEQLADYVTARYARTRTTPCACHSICVELGRKPRCITRLLPVQAWALHEISLKQGLLGSLATGSGKSFLDLLAPLAMPNCRRAILLCPPNLVTQLIGDYRMLAEHFHVPSLQVHGTHAKRFVANGMPELHVVAYSMLSSPKQSDWIRITAPDVIIADECHHLKDPDSARTRRVRAYFREHGATTRFCGWTGSLTDSSLKDYAHLSAFSLRLGSPVPLDPDEIDNWARAIDASESPADGGALLDGLIEYRFCDDGTDDVQAGFHRRLTETLGFVATTEASVDVRLILGPKAAPTIPADITGHLRTLREQWVRPDGEELVDALQVAKVARELACGFYYRWKFIHGETVAEIIEWLAARKLWNCELRYELAREHREWMDSPGLCQHAAERAWGHRPKQAGRPEWRAEHWPRWNNIRARVKPVTEAIQINDYLVQDAATWARENRGIVWYEAREFGMWLAKESGLPLYTGGPDAGERIAKVTNATSIIASVLSHGTGRDGLQHWFTDQLIIQHPSSSIKCEQLLGRLIRQGQEADEVRALYYAHTPELAKAAETAKMRARYVNRTVGANQQLLAGSGE